MGYWLDWWDVGWVEGMLDGLEGVRWVGRMLIGSEGCWVGWRDVGRVDGMLGGLVGCWLGW